jgi:hypothetical protein
MKNDTKQKQHMSDEKCCAVSCDVPLGQTYWDNQYQSNSTGWDLGEVSPALKLFIDQIKNKNAAILIPGCGNTYEATYLLETGFTSVTVIDIAPTLVSNLISKFEDNKNITVILGDFFEHKGTYDLIFEQTFFCALPPAMRQKYVYQMHRLLSKNGTLAGLLFDRSFEVSPPFGGSRNEYEQLFQQTFVFKTIEIATQSVVKRQNTELLFEFQKNNIVVNLYDFKGIDCNGCKKTITDLFFAIEGVKNVSLNVDFSEVLIVSEQEIELQILRKLISYNEKYKINKVNK